MSEAPDPAEQPHILVVDDDARLRELLRRYLTSNGFIVSTAGNAAEARARLQGIAFDLLVVDIMMPGETGLELTEAPSLPPPSTSAAPTRASTKSGRS
ncbi:MAG TPA: response regulator [Bryobacteraceae bacterium]|nr:response regulator [Bryobacteraceae bacterium]